MGINRLFISLGIMFILGLLIAPVTGEFLSIDGSFEGPMLVGQEEYDRFGTAVEVVGDMDGDGFADLAVSSMQRRSTSTYAGNGRVDVFAGGPIISSEPMLTVTGTQALEELGWGLGGGDVNGDGFADLIMGSHMWDISTDRSYGRMYIVFGGEDVFEGPAGPGRLMSASSADIRLSGAAKSTNFGYTFAVADLNTDGYDDIAVGSPDYDSGVNGVDCGRVEIFLGGKEGITRALTIEGRDDPDPGDYGFSENSNVPATNFSSSISFGDFNGDGTPDLFVGSPYENGILDLALYRDLGFVYVFDGATALVPNLDNSSAGELDAGDATVTISSEGYAFEIFGYDLVSGFDYNDDGKDDLLVSSEEWRPLDLDKFRKGEVWLFMGTVLEAASVGDGTLGVADAAGRIYGEDGGDRFGHAVAAGDMDGNGLDDIFIGAPNNDNGTSNEEKSGRAYMIAGGTSLAGDLELENLPIAGVTVFESGDVDARFGTSLATGDLTGTGDVELLVGGSHYSKGTDDMLGMVRGYTAAFPTSDMLVRYSQGGEACLGGLSTVFIEVGNPSMTGLNVTVGITGLETVEFMGEGVGSTVIQGEGYFAQVTVPARTWRTVSAEFPIETRGTNVYPLSIQPDDGDEVIHNIELISKASDVSAVSFETTAGDMLDGTLPPGQSTPLVLTYTNAGDLSSTGSVTIRLRERTDLTFTAISGGTASLIGLTEEDNLASVARTVEPNQTDELSVNWLSGGGIYQYEAGFIMESWGTGLSLCSDVNPDNEVIRGFLVVNSPPTADISTSSPEVRIGAEMTFTAANVTDDGVVVAYLFDFGDGDDSGWITTDTASHVYSQTTEAGFHAKVKARDQHGVESSWSDSVTVVVRDTDYDGLPSAHLVVTPDPARTDEAVTFDGSASWDDVGIVQYRFFPGDGSAPMDVSTSSTQYIYSENGIYTVRLQVKDTAGQYSDNATYSILVRGHVTAVKMEDKPDEGRRYSYQEVITFDGRLSTFQYDNVNGEYLWESDIDGVLGTTSVVTTNLSAGFHTLTLTVTHEGESDSLSFTLDVFETNIPPVAEMSPRGGDDYYSDTAIHFQSTGTYDEDGDILTFKWYDNGELISEQKGFQHILENGDHVIRMIVSDGIDTDTIEYVFNVTAKPLVIITSPTEGQTLITEKGIIFDARETTDADSAYLKFLWTAERTGSGPVTIGQSSYVNVDSLEPGQYTIKLLVEDDDDNVVIKQVHITVISENDPPTPRVVGLVDGSLPAIRGKEMTLDASSTTDPDGDVTGFVWEIDGVGAKGHLVGEVSKFTFDLVASYRTTLTVTDDNGTSAELVFTVVVGDAPDDGGGGGLPSIGGMWTALALVGVAVVIRRRG